MKKKILMVLALALIATCFMAIAISAEEIDPNAAYYDKVYVNESGREFPIYENVDGVYYPLVWFAYDIMGVNEETGEEVVVETKYVKARFEDISCYSLEPSQGRFNGCFYTYVDEDGTEIELNTKNLVVLNLRAGTMAVTYNSSKKQNGTDRTILTIETNRTDAFPGWNRIEAIYIPHTQKTVGSLSWGSLRVCDIDVNHPIPVTIGNKAFQNSKLEELFIPGGSKFDGNSNFQGCTKLKKVVFGEGAVPSFPGYLFDRCSSLEVVYFMGSEAEMDAISVTTNNNSYYINATKISAAEYEALTEKSGRYKVYDCTPCLAFNGGVHTPSDEKIAIGNDYFASVKIACPCLVEGCTATMVVDTIAPLFASKGYSAKTFGEGISLVQAYEINKEAIEAYKAFAPEFDFGILAYANVSGESVAPVPGGEKVLDIVFDNMANDYVEVKLTSIPESERNTLIVFCAYVTVGDKIYYLENGATTESAYGVCYNDFVE